MRRDLFALRFELLYLRLLGGFLCGLFLLATHERHALYADRRQRKSTHRKRRDDLAGFQIEQELPGGDGSVDAAAIEIGNRGNVFRFVRHFGAEHARLLRTNAVNIAAREK